MMSESARASRAVCCALAINVVVFLTSCHRAETDVEIGNRLQILHKGNGQEVQDLDPQIVNSVSSLNIISALLEGLVAEDPYDLHPIPGVAESWEVSADEKIYTFHLRHNAKWTKPGRYVGNGPFTLQEWRLNDRVRVKRSATYWDAQNVRLNEIVFHTIDSNDIEERAFRSGQLHVTDSMPINRIDRYRRQQPEFLRIDTYLGTYFYRVNVTRPPLNSRLVRRAIAMAIDRQSLVVRVTVWAALSTSCFTRPNTAGYTCQSSSPYDVDLARRTLAQAGYPNGRGLPALEILFHTSENHKLIAEAIQQMTRHNLNVATTLMTKQLTVYFD